MPERTHSCNCGYSPADAFEAFEHLSYLLLQCGGWRLSPRELPPPESPFYVLLRAVLTDLHALGYARPLPGGGWLLLKKKRWHLLLRCARECVNCKHARKCPLAALFRKKKWLLPDEQLINQVYLGEGEEEGVNRSYVFIKKIGVWQKAFNDLLLVLTHKRTLSLIPHTLYNLTGDPARSNRLGKLLKHLQYIGLAERINRSKKRKRYRLIPQPIWRCFIQICGSKPPSERYKCSTCPLAPQCPYVIATRVGVTE